MNGFVEGERVELTRDVERYPHFIAPEGARGTVVHVSPEQFSVRMDEPIEGAEEWDNEVCWYAGMYMAPPWDEVRSTALKSWRTSDEIWGGGKPTRGTGLAVVR